MTRGSRVLVSGALLATSFLALPAHAGGLVGGGGLIGGNEGGGLVNIGTGQAPENGVVNIGIGDDPSDNTLEVTVGGTGNHDPLGEVTVDLGGQDHRDHGIDADVTVGGRSDPAVDAHLDAGSGGADLTVNIGRRGGAGGNGGGTGGNGGGTGPVIGNTAPLGGGGTAPGSRGTPGSGRNVGVAASGNPGAIGGTGGAAGGDTSLRALTALLESRDWLRLSNGSAVCLASPAVQTVRVSPQQEDEARRLIESYAGDIRTLRTLLANCGDGQWPAQVSLDRVIGLDVKADGRAVLIVI